MNPLLNTLLTPVKPLLRPVYQWALRKGWATTAAEKQQQTVFSAFDVFAGMSRLAGIGGIEFNDGKCVIALSDGRRYRFNPAVKAAQLYSVPFLGTFEQKETACLPSLIHNGDVCIDVGASFGWYSVLFSNLVGEQGKVYAFEPLPENIEVLQGNLAENQTRNVYPLPLALGEEKASTKIYRADIGVSGSLRLHDYRNDFEEIDCNIDTLDAFVASENIQRIDFIKADIEGGELAFLKGGLEALRRFRPVLMLEIQEHSTRLFGYEPDAVFDLLEGLGYTAYFVPEDGANGDALQAVDRDTTDWPDYNFLFLPESEPESEPESGPESEPGSRSESS